MSKKWKLEKKPGDVCWDEVFSTTITSSELSKAVMEEKTKNNLRGTLWDAIIELLPKSISSKYYFVALEGNILCGSETYARALGNFLSDMGFCVGIYKHDDECDLLYGYWCIYLACPTLTGSGPSWMKCLRSPKR